MYISYNLYKIILISCIILLHSDITESNLILNKVECNNEKDCNYNGKCFKGICHCNYGVVSVDNTVIKPNIDLNRINKIKNNEPDYDILNSNGCNYNQKYQIYAFVYELFPGFGIGHLYANRIKHGAIKLISCILILVFVLLYPILIKIFKSKYNNHTLCFILAICFLCSCIGISFIIMYDIIMFGSNNFKDGNGIDLIPFGRK